MSSHSAKICERKLIKEALTVITSERITDTDCTERLNGPKASIQSTSYQHEIPRNFTNDKLEAKYHSDGANDVHPTTETTTKQKHHTNENHEAKSRETNGEKDKVK